MPVKKIPTSEIEIGMFISSLDRPWSETPFLFQGFLVRESEEIKQLRQYTEHVYILIPDEEIELQSLSTDHTPSVMTNKELHKNRYQIETDAGEEILMVRTDHEKLADLVVKIEDISHTDPELIGHRLTKPIKIMVDSIKRNPDAYIWLSRLKKYDSYLYRDSLNASIWGTVFGRQLGLDEGELSSLAMGTMLMDIGKTALPQELLHKKSQLTHDEWTTMKSHVDQGLRILSKCRDINPDILDIVRTHHERLDGSGYPAALTRNQIPLFGQMAGIVDFYVSVTTPRPFAETISPSNAIQMLYEQRGRYLDETLVEHFIQVLGTYPTGSLVELSSGEIGIVVSQNPSLRLKPNVMLLLDAEKQPYGAQPIVSMAQYTYGKEKQPVSIVKTIHEGKYGLNVGELSL